MPRSTDCHLTTKLLFNNTDPEFLELWDNFAFDEVIRHGALDDRPRFLSILSALMGCRGLDAFRAPLPAATRAGLTPVAVKELVYQVTAYLGFGRALPFLKAVNEALTENGVQLPLPGQATTTPDTRRQAAPKPRWTSSARGRGTSGTAAPRRAATSTYGWLGLCRHC